MKLYVTHPMTERDCRSSLLRKKYFRTCDKSESLIKINASGKFHAYHGSKSLHVS